MRFFHISDLHIGKQLYSYSLGENQREILGEVVEKIKEYHPDALLICGDIFDRSIPSGEAYSIFDEFLTAVSGIKPEVTVLMIAGNHDSAERLRYASNFLRKHRIHISVLPPGRPEEFLQKVVLQDEYGPVNFYLLPFLKPGYVRGLANEAENLDYEGAVRLVLSRETYDFSERNVLLSHQFYKNGTESPTTCESEQASLNVGGLDSVDVSLVKDFDYVALGHIHGAQKVGNPNVRYCGTLLKYSVSEEKHKKSITMVTLKKKGEEPLIETIPIKGSQDVRSIYGTLNEVLALGEQYGKDFVSVTLTDEGELYRPKERLSEVYEYLLDLKVDNQRTRELLKESGEKADFASPLEAFQRFYEDVQHTPLSEEEWTFLEQILERAREE